MQDCSISIANTLEILQFCTKPSIYTIGMLVASVSCPPQRVIAAR